jgi:pyridoxal 5'-phosphate synthase pdxT subunit
VNAAPVVGVLAVQGAFAAHAEALGELGVTVREVRTVEELREVDALVMPGGESTTMSKLLVTFGLFDPIGERLAAGMPVFGTCAGMILLASTVLDGRRDQRCFSALPIEVRRNGYGRQIDSFETDIDIADVPGGPFPAVFIRAPLLERAAPSVTVMASVDGHPVLCRYRNVLVSAFHPELTGDRRIHRYFVDVIVRGL